MTERIHLPYKVELRDYQRRVWNAFFKDGIRHFLLVWHRRAGKSKFSVNLACGAAHQDVGAYYYLFPTLKQARTAIWEGRGKSESKGEPGVRFMDHFPEKLIKRPNNQEMKQVFTNDSIFRLLGTDRSNYDRMMGTNPLGVLYDEQSQQNPMAREYINPILAENGGWEMIIGTPRGHNHFYDLYQQVKDDPKWYTEILTVDDTRRSDGSPVITEEAIEQFRRGGMSDDKIKQEFYCSFEAAVSGAYFSKELADCEAQDKIKNFPIDPSLPINTYWDLGLNDSTSIWVAQHTSMGEIRLIAYYENNNEAIAHYINWVNDFRNKHGLVFGHHFGPHDVTTRELGTGKSIRDLAYEQGFRFERIPRIPEKRQSIEMARRIFRRCYFHKDNCKQGLACLREYHKAYNESMQTFGDRPVHNWASHGADAFQTLAQSIDKKYGSGNIDILTDRLLTGYND